MSTIFGPVPSRRLGRSLGIDVIPAKTCSYDCVYCESGRTTHLSLQRKAFVPPEEVLKELEAYFAAHPGGADVLTFSSAGEPTLYEPLEELLRAIKRRFTSLPLVVLTNGSLLWDPKVRKALASADRVAPTLDAVSPEIFQRVNRPHPGLSLESILEGLGAFRREYGGRLHIEVVLVAGMNDQEEELRRIVRAIEKIHPDRIELNTVVRPPADPDVEGLSTERMQAASRFFPSERTQVIGVFRPCSRAAGDPHLDGRILEMVRRRPCTEIEMAASLGVAPEDLDRVLAKLERESRLARHIFRGQEYLCLKGQSDSTMPRH